MISSSYLDVAFDPRKSDATIKGIITLISKAKIQFDTVVFRGMSGALIAPIVAHKLGKNLILCRKKSDDSHSGQGICEGWRGNCQYIIIDDFICSGATIRATLDAMKQYSEANRITTVCKHIVLYRADRSSSFSYTGDIQIPVSSLCLDDRNRPIFNVAC